MAFNLFSSHQKSEVLAKAFKKINRKTKKQTDQKKSETKTAQKYLNYTLIMFISAEDLFSPGTSQNFLHAFTKQERLFWRSNNADLFEKLLPWADFNSLITIERLQQGECRLVLRGRDLPLEMVSVPGADGTRRLAQDLLQQHCHAGLSIAVNNAHATLPKIGTLTAMLERTLGVECGANIYASFTRQSAFRTHADEHDVLVLQVAGSKRWLCFGNSPQPSSSAEQNEEPEWEGVLQPGDLMYVPRGDFHRAEVEGGASLHLTIRLVRPRVHDVINWLSQQGAAAGILEQDVIRDLPEEIAALQTQKLKAALHRLVDEFDLDAFFAHQDQSRPAFMPLNLGYSAELRSETRILLTLRRRIVLPSSGPATVQVGGAPMTFNQQECAVLAQLQTQDGLFLSQIFERCAAVASAAELEATVARLARRSLVRLA